MIAGSRVQPYLKRSKGQMKLKAVEEMLLLLLISGEHDLKSAGETLNMKIPTTVMKLRRSRERNGIKTLYQQIAVFTNEQRMEKVAKLIGGERR